jgi:acyl-CoA thioester hydrolase
LYNADGAAMLGVQVERFARNDPRRRKQAMTQKPKLLVHTSHQSIRWGDMDALGHVNNVTYFRYLEQTRIEWVYAYESSDPVIVNASCTFLEPLVYPGDIEVRMYLGDPGRTSIGSYYEIWMNGRKYADGAAKMVWIDLASGRSVPVPDAVAAPLRALEAI